MSSEFGLLRRRGKACRDPHDGAWRLNRNVWTAGVEKVEEGSSKLARWGYKGEGAGKIGFEVV